MRDAGARAWRGGGCGATAAAASPAPAGAAGRRRPAERRRDLALELDARGLERRELPLQRRHLRRPLLEPVLGVAGARTWSSSACCAEASSARRPVTASLSRTRSASRRAAVDANASASRRAAPSAPQLRHLLRHRAAARLGGGGAASASEHISVRRSFSSRRRLSEGGGRRCVRRGMVGDGWGDGRGGEARRPHRRASESCFLSDWYAS